MCFSDRVAKGKFRIGPGKEPEGWQKVLSNDPNAPDAVRDVSSPAYGQPVYTWKHSSGAMASTMLRPGGLADISGGIAPKPGMESYVYYSNLPSGLKQPDSEEGADAGEEAGAGGATTVPAYPPIVVAGTTKLRPDKPTPADVETSNKLKKRRKARAKGTRRNVLGGGGESDVDVLKRSLGA